MTLLNGRGCMIATTFQLVQLDGSMEAVPPCVGFAGYTWAAWSGVLCSMPFLFCGPSLLQNQNSFVDLFTTCQFDFQNIHTFT